MPLLPPCPTHFEAGVNVNQRDLQSTETSTQCGSPRQLAKWKDHELDYDSGPSLERGGIFDKSEARSQRSQRNLLSGWRRPRVLPATGNRSATVSRLAF